jgi:hypothetical protein
VLKLKERTSNTINRGRQVLDCKNQDLIARILLGGRTGMQICENSGALYAKHHSRTVDLRSNGCECACAVDRAVHLAHGSTVDRVRGGMPQLI